MDEIEMTNKVCRNGIRKRPNSFLTRFFVGEDAEVGVKKVVRLADRYRELQPVASG